MTQAALESWAQGRGATKGGARALARHLVASFAGRSNAEQPSRALLEEASQFERELPKSEAIEDRDGTVRFAITLSDGEIVESVLIRQPGRDTVCVSSQVGCARGCVFCETGRLGLVRNLTSAEIVAQYAIAVQHVARAGASGGPKNVVFMGMGEPLDNLAEVIRAIEVLREPSGFQVPERRITVSTVGIVPKLPELFARTKAQVAVSLHAIDETQRLALLPVARRWPLAELRAAIAQAPRSVLLQWTLIEGVNDSLEEAGRLAAFAQGLDVRVNLIPLNPGPIAAQRAPPIAHCRAFQKTLADRGVRTLLRLPHGQETFAACGQLAGSRRA
jgi:23S rRNA (adenine2503-C2)-methyltransferase